MSPGYFRFGTQTQAAGVYTHRPVDAVDAARSAATTTARTTKGIAMAASKMDADGLGPTLWVVNSPPPAFESPPLQ